MKKSLIALVAAQALFAGGDISPVEPEINLPDEAVAAAPARHYNAALKVGTLGIGADISRMVTDKIGLRVNINGLRVNRAEDLDDVSYDATLTLLTVGVLADYYPFDNAFRLSGGAYYHGNKFEGTATPAATETIDIGDNTYTGAQIGRLDTKVDFNKFAPYLGMGWGNKAVEKGWGFTFDIGALYQGSPSVYAKAVPNAALPQATKDQIAADVEKERKQIEDDVTDYKWYPVVMIGVNYTF